MRILTPKYYMYSLEHPIRNSIFNEINAVVAFKKEKKIIGDLIFKRYKKEKYPDNKGLIESCILIRNHNDKRCIKIMEKWFKEIKKNSHRDQLSFNYINWKNDIKIKYISKNFVFDYFRQNITHIINKIYTN